MAKANMSITRNQMPTQDPRIRAHNFDEVALGYSEETAINEAMRCLNCKNMPCVDGCPVKIHIPEFISAIKEGDFEGAYQIITKSSSLPAVCGRVCPQETQCESKCVRGIKGESVGIGRLERFVADWHNTFAKDAPEKPESNGHKVAIVGSGPSGLTCAGDLAKKGYDVTVYEARFYKMSNGNGWGYHIADEAKDTKALPLKDIPERYFSEIVLQLAKATASSKERSADWKKDR